MHNQGIECLSREEASVELTSVVKKDPSVILGITKTAQKLVFSDSHDHSVNFCIDGKVIHSLGGSQPGMQDGFTVRFHSPSALVSYGESIFVCDTSNQAVRLISSLKSYKHLGEKLGLFIELFQLEEELSRKPSFQPSLEDGLIILKEAADFMKDVERQAYFRTGRRCPQGPDLALSKPTRDAFKMLHSSFEKTNSFFSENDLQHIAKDICFPSFTTLHVEHFFAGMRTPSRPTPDMHDYGSRRPSCIVESVQKVYHSSFSVYTGPQSHYTERTINKREPEWLYDRAKLSEEHFRQEDSVKEKDVLREESRELRLFAKEFGQGVRQQRVRDKTKEKAGTLPLSLSMIRRVQTNQTQNVVDMLEELQALDAGQPETAQIETRPVRFSKGDVVALKHNWKRYLEPFFLAILQEDLHCSNGGILERTMRINWLEPSEEDALLYTVGNEDNNNPPQCILDIVTVVQDGEKFILCRNEEQRLKNLANGSDEADYDSSSEDDSDGDKSEDDDDQPTRFEAGRSRSGRRVTRFVL